ncbi:MAG: FAD-dependent oxidoreductase [Thermodesulfobacteriota bacterium]|nr:FAD-dependent oxidoreductase [Thermodesulfobacteriota bacterium]
MKVAIIGMGPAGVNVVKTLRNNGFNDSITMFSAEKIPPYSPPSLGEYLITGNEDALFWEGKDFCGKYNVNCKAGEKIAQIMPGEKKLKTENDEIFEFDYLVIATGTSLYAPVKGSDKKGISDFKTFVGTDKIKRMAKEDREKTAIIVGGGFIGVEIALCLAKIGIKASVLNRRGWIMPRLIDTETAKYVENDLRSQGVNVMLNTEGKEFIGEEHVEGLLTTDGRELKADIYITATGVKPSIDLIKNTDIEYDTGIIVNENLQTKYPYIYACGDVAETVELVSGERKIHGLFPVAVNHAETVAYNILGMKREYERQINMNSLKKLGFKLIVVGKREGEEIKYKTENILRKIYIKDDKIIGFVLLEDISNAGVYLSLFTKRVNVSKFKDKLLSKYFYPGILMTQIL